MLFDQLDIERQLESSWIESRLYCNIKKRCADGSTPSIWDGSCDDGSTAVWVPDEWEDDKPPPADASPDKAGMEQARDQERSIRRGETNSPKGAAAERKARWQDQCFLIEGWRPITDKFQKCSKRKEASGYQNVIPVRAESANIVSVLADRENANLFFSLTPAQLSMLVPSIRLFIVRYKEEKRPDGKTVIVEDDKPRELFLDDFTEQDLVKSIMSGQKGRAHAVGLESFNYEFDGKDPATTDTLIKANLNLIFTSFDSLTKTQENGAKFLDLLLRTKKMVKSSRREDTSKPNDNIYNWCKKETSKDKKETNSELEFNPQYKRIKASVGWAIPPGNLFFESFAPDIQDKVNAEFKTKIINLLESLKLHLFLEMTDYDLDFDNNGKVKLSINYRAAVEGELTEKTSNIFYHLENSVKKSKERAAKDKRKAKEAREKEKEKTPADEQKEKQKELAEREREENASADRRAAARINGDKLYWYSFFMDELESTQRLIKVTLKPESMDLWRGNREFAPPGTEMSGSDASQSSGMSAGEILKSVFEGDTDHGTWSEVNHGNNTRHQKNNPSSDAGRAGQDAREQSEEEAEEAARAEDRGEDPKKDKEKELQKASETSNTNAIGERSIYFTFMGDILDAAMTIVNKYNAPSTGKESTVTLVTSQLNFSDPAGQMRDNDKRLSTMNISDIPVSYDEFILWFHNNITKPGRTYYPIMDFIKDVMTNLVFQAFGYNCIGGAPAIVPVLNYTIFDVPKKNGRPPLTPGFRYNGLSEIKKMKKGISNTLTKSPSEVVNYIILHGSARSFVNKNAENLEQDERDGIYHFGLGLDRGILKDIKFSGNTLKYATETRVIEDGQSGIEQLFEKFDATVNLYGCPIFRNGQYVYLDPRTMGVGSDIARAIGLGGYYVVYNVAGDLNRSNYTMQLKCKYQGSGLCGGETIDISRDACATDIMLNELAAEIKDVTGAEMTPEKVEEAIEALPEEQVGAVTDPFENPNPDLEVPDDPVVVVVPDN